MVGTPNLLDIVSVEGSWAQVVSPLHKSSNPPYFIVRYLENGLFQELYSNSYELREFNRSLGDPTQASDIQSRLRIEDFNRIQWSTEEPIDFNKIGNVRIWGELKKRQEDKMGEINQEYPDF